MTDNLILKVDSYKFCHSKCLPPGTEYISSYIESRGGRFEKTVWFGLQMYLKSYLQKPIARHDIDEAEEVVTAHGLPFNRAGWELILDKHGGFLPLRIKAAPEGSVIDTHNVLLTAENTDSCLPWLTGFVETSLMRGVWYPTTVATVSYYAKLAILDALNKSSDDPDGQIPFKLHDFGARGNFSGEGAAIAGAAHLVNFLGTDTLEGVMAARRYYGEPMAGFSVNASEHSVICAWGQEREVDAYRNMLTQFAKPGSIVAVVSDSYDLYNAVSNIWGGVLKETVEQSGATVVIRPDSGVVTVVPVDVVRLLSEKFGFTVNSKGYKVLPSCVRVIQGDGISIDTIPVILNNLLLLGFSADNICFGMGAGLHAKCDRDTKKFAMKASAISSNGVWKGISKNPLTDPGKRSRAGRLVLIQNKAGEYQTVPLEGNAGRDCLHTVYDNGRLLNQTTFAAVRELANRAMVR